VTRRFFIGIELVANFVHFLFSARAGIEPVREVDHHPHHRSDVLIGVHNPRGDDQRAGRIFPCQQNLPVHIGWRLFSVVPEIDLECRRPDESEEVGLVDVLVGTPGNSRTGHGDIHHHRPVCSINLILPEELREPAAGIAVLDKIPDCDTFDFPVHTHGRKTLQSELSNASALAVSRTR
jgi:hypothetical protein